LTDFQNSFTVQTQPETRSKSNIKGPRHLKRVATLWDLYKTP